MPNPECPRHGANGLETSRVATASVIRYGVSSRRRPRQIFLCRFELTDGAKGQHKFPGGFIPRLMALDPVCSDCGQGLDDWRGEKVFENYWFPAKPVATALSQMAGGTTYRKAASNLRRMAGRSAQSLEPRRAATLSLIHALRQSGDGSDAALARELEYEHPLRPHSREAALAQWLVQTFAPILHRALAPQSWPEAGIVAVDSMHMNLLGKHKYVDEHGVDLDEYRETDDEGNLLMPPDGAFDLEIQDVEKSRPTLTEMLDPDDAEEEALRQRLEQFQPDIANPRPGLQGGVPCWQVFGAYGYEPSELGTFPRGEETGRLWLLRSYYRPNSQAWAHFFRQLPGTPAYILSDMAPEIRVGVELAWGDPKTRPQLLICEHHATEAVKRAVTGEKRLELEACRLFQTHGRRVEGDYEPFVSNGEPGSELRLWHFQEFCRLAREAEVVKREGVDFEEMFDRPIWRRIKDQVVRKDHTLRYSTGALETALYDLAKSSLSQRRGWMKNRHRTDDLLALMQLSALGVADADNFARVIEHYLKHNPMPRQDRRTDSLVLGPSLRQRLPDEALKELDIPTGEEYSTWRRKRRDRLGLESAKHRYHHDAALREARLKRGRSWRSRHSEEQSQKALERSKAQKAADPEKFAAQRRDQGRRRRERLKKIAAVVARMGVDQTEARRLLEAVEWDLEAVVPVPPPPLSPTTPSTPKVPYPLIPPTSAEEPNAS